MKRFVLAALVLATASSALHAQSVYTANRLGDLQVGGGYTIANSAVGSLKFKGYMIYADYDFNQHWGVEAEFHQTNEASGGTGMYEKTYEIGGRYHRAYFNDRVKPYVKALYGRGVFNYPNDIANLAYNIGAAGAGIDIPVAKRINVRLIDFEYQRWFGFPPNGLTPTLFSFGVAYHFGSDRFPDRKPRK